MEKNHFQDRYVVHTVYGQHYGNFPTLKLAEKHAKSLTEVIDYLEVSYNGIVYAIITK